jgi:hypothetical protein
MPWISGQRRTWKVGEETFHRKHAYLPCVISERIEQMSEAERADAYRAAWFLDSLSDGEWKAVLGEDGASKAAKSRAKRKLTGWLVVLGHVQTVNPELFEAALTDAFTIHKQQFESAHPLWLPWRYFVRERLAALRAWAASEGKVLISSWQTHPKLEED